MPVMDAPRDNEPMPRVQSEKCAEEKVGMWATLQAMSLSSPVAVRGTEKLLRKSPAVLENCLQEDRTPQCIVGNPPGTHLGRSRPSS